MLRKHNIDIWILGYECTSPKKRPSQGHLSPGKHFFPFNWPFTSHEESLEKKYLSPQSSSTQIYGLKHHYATKIASAATLILHLSPEWADGNKKKKEFTSSEFVLSVCLDKTLNFRNNSNVLTICCIQSTHFDLESAQVVQILYLKMNQAGSL